MWMWRPSRMLSSTLMPLKSARFWKVRATPRAAPSYAVPVPVMSCPSSRMLSALRRIEAGDRVGQRGLATAVRADEAEDLAALDVQVDAVERHDAAESAARHCALQNRIGALTSQRKFLLDALIALASVLKAGQFFFRLSAKLTNVGFPCKLQGVAACRFGRGVRRKTPRALLLAEFGFPLFPKRRDAFARVVMRKEQSESHRWHDGSRRRRGRDCRTICAIRTANRGFEAMRSAKERASASSSACGTTRSTRPSRKASSAEIGSPSMLNSLALARPTISCSRTIANPGSRPSLISGTANLARSDAMMKSDAMASSKPPP